MTGTAKAAPAPPPLPPGSASGISLHVSHVETRLAAQNAHDNTGRRALSEARVSLKAAQAALAGGNFVAADQLAASVDDLMRAAGPTAAPPQPPPPPPPPPIEPAGVLADVDTIAAALADVALPRVRDLIAFAQRAAGTARREIALGQPDAAVAAARAESIARAAAHVAIASDPALNPVLPHPPPPPSGPPRTP